MIRQGYRRHPCDRGEPAQRAVSSALRWMLDHRSWRRHPVPFSKTHRGRLRREERRFVRATQHTIH